MKKLKKRNLDADELMAGDELDQLVAINVYGHVHDISWFIKSGRKVLYYGPKFSTNLTESIKALAHYYKNHSTVMSYNLNHQMEEGPYSCTAELRLAYSLGNGIYYVRSWGRTMPLALARMLAKAPQQ